MKIIRADVSHISDVAILFDLYRQFYECEADLELATNYIAERIKNNESVIHVAIDGNAICGFVQMYPTFCSVQAVKIFVLYDLFVEKNARKRGVGELLMNKASEYARANGAARMDLSTAFTNRAGQHLYEKLGYKKVLQDFYNYSLIL
ncbi:MAG: ribosomal protein S18 acetylase RimI-like enzyme [Parasphingorhabdus sp.]